MEQRARFEARRNDWLQRLPSTPDPTPSVFVAPIAAGEKVVASTKSEVFKFLSFNYGDAVAVEMEGIGFLQTVRANQQVSALVIRGISDLIDGKSEVDARGYQEIAARHASAFAFQLLVKFSQIEKRQQTNSIPLLPKELPQEDYIRLKNLLASGRWREANETTRTIMLKAVKREKEGWLTDEQIQNFSCQVLQVIDHLWVQYSEQRFGFSVQKRIFNECEKDLQTFGDRVGWHVQEAWISASQVSYTPANAPEGHLPWGIMQVVTMDNAVLDAFVYGLRTITKTAIRQDWQKQLLADFMAFGGIFTGYRIDKEEFKRNLEYELSHNEAWWEGKRLEELKILKLFSLLAACPNL